MNLTTGQKRTWKKKRATKKRKENGLPKQYAEILMTGINTNWRTPKPHLVTQKMLCAEQIHLNIQRKGKEKPKKAIDLLWKKKPDWEMRNKTPSHCSSSCKVRKLKKKVKVWRLETRNVR